MILFDVLHDLFPKNWISACGGVSVGIVPIKWMGGPMLGITVSVDVSILINQPTRILAMQVQVCRYESFTLGRRTT
jgi:hypothetical protein